jgi:LCP family protein required for cell wall assembly
MRRNDVSDDPRRQQDPRQQNGRRKVAERSVTGRSANGRGANGRGANGRGANGRGANGRGASAGGGKTRGGKGGGRRYSTQLRATGILAGTLTLAVVAGSLFFYGKYREVWDSIKRVDVSGDLHFKQPPTDPNAINILLIGSDSRAGINGKIGGQDQGQRSDTVMVMHIAPGAHRAVVLSFPRDSVVPVYSCTAEKGAPGQSADPGNVEQINSSFANGGPGCLWKTIDETTHIHINDFVELTFIGFEKVINDLHGVTVCLPAAVDNKASNLHLKAGRHHIYGAQALAFWRTREFIGEGSDIQRIQRDQFLMASLLQGIEKSGLLTSTSKMTSVVGDVAKNMTTDKGLDQSRMLTIAEGMRGLASKSVQFIEVPSETYLPNNNWVQWTPQATQLFAAIAHDTKLPAAKPKPRTKADGIQVNARAAAAVTVSPAQVKVEVLNGSGADKVAAQGSADLTSAGFDVVGSGNADNFNYTNSVIEYHSRADLAAARTVEREFDSVEILREPSVPAGTIDAILGSSFTALKVSDPAHATADLTQTFGGITGNTRICKDNSAFSGPDGE